LGIPDLTEGRSDAALLFFLLFSRGLAPGEWRKLGMYATDHSSGATTMGNKERRTSKEVKKKPAKTLEEKRAAKREKKQTKGFVA
jgi:hypothetical protein